MRYVKGHFVLTGLDVPSMRFKSRPEARDLVQAAYPRLADQGERKGNVLRYAGARKARVCCTEPLADRVRHVARRGIRDRSVYPAGPKVNRAFTSAALARATLGQAWPRPW